MRFSEIANQSNAVKPIKPLPPEQARIEALKKQKETVSKQLDAERNRQNIAKAQQTLTRAKQSIQPNS